METIKLGEMTVTQLTEAFASRYGDLALCNVPDCEFSTGGYFAEMARRSGYSSGRAAANELNLWKHDAVSAIRFIWPA